MIVWRDQKADAMKSIELELNLQTLGLFEKVLFRDTLNVSTYYALCLAYQTLCLILSFNISLCDFNVLQSRNEIINDKTHNSLFS